MLEINEIIDNDFLNKDVSKLVEGDYYLFHVEHIEGCTYNYFYKDGIVFIGSFHYESDTDGMVEKFEYTKGTLEDCLKELIGEIECTRLTGL